jgi:hypothetical protein
MILWIQNLPLFCQFSHCEARPVQAGLSPTLSSAKNRAQAFAIALGFAAVFCAPKSVEAALYKCQVAGKTVYQDKECPGLKDSKPYTPKNPINTISSEAITGQPKKEVDNRPAWLKPIDPIGDCKAKGGTVDKELRACIVP